MTKITIESDRTNFQIDLTKLMNKSFRDKHNALLSSKYFKGFLEIMQGVYYKHRDKMIPYKPETLFKPFLTIDHSDVRCVILGNYPYPDGNGILCGTEKATQSQMNAEIVKLMNHFVSNGHKWFYESLDEWPSEGVLGLNTIPFYILGKDMEQYRNIYRQFLANIIYQLYKSNPHIVIATTSVYQESILTIAKIPAENIVYGNGYLSLRNNPHSTIFDKINSKLEKFGKPTIMFSY